MTALYDSLVADFWPLEWSSVGSATGRDAQEARKKLRKRAEQLLDDARRMTNPAAEVPAATANPENVSIATAADAFGLLVLIQESDHEQAILTRDYGKVREVIAMATDRTPMTDADGVAILPPIFGVIVSSGVVEGACGLFPTQPWDSWESYLRGFFLFVRTESRQTAHFKNLLQWSNWFSDRSQMPIVWEVNHSRALDDRSRLFLRHASPFGGMFLHRPVAA